MPEKAIDSQTYIEYVKRINDSRISPPLAHIHNYGCQLNVSDGEKMKGQLMKMGFGFTDSAENADLVLFNTCAVREGAQERVLGNLGFLKHYKELNKNMIIGIGGCMTQQSQVAEKIKQSYRFVDLVFGTGSISKLPQMIYDVYNGRKCCEHTENDLSLNEGIEQVRDSAFKASVPIMYGCNNFCTYCIVPYVRGRERSRSPRLIIDEVTKLVDSGYKEIMLLGQNVNSYGNDLEDENTTFPQLLRMINDIPGEFIIRFMSSHPKDATPELIDAIIECPKAAKHLHLPVQSGSNEILDKMNRRYTVQKYLETVDYARSKISDFSFTTDIIVGFPNESNEDFEKTLDIMRTVRYDNIYSFIYSVREGTKAALIEDRTPHSEKQERMQRLLELQREISTQSYKRFEGRVLDVLVDSTGRSGEGSLTGKSNEFVIVNFSGDRSLIGNFVKVKITKAHNWALDGELVED
ncbi:MAG: tRNA (N6-isopentenyl adenosine(37)-C2)-methylthiotransferase MiaB [Oscillospiraceae bacterium]|nr:tRNA (N6-isopentenyl adenosine(37)-C2)-methylthiotransferase MiaB [Oscillospiraceae bacterium]